MESIPDNHNTEHLRITPETILRALTPGVTAIADVSPGSLFGAVGECLNAVIRSTGTVPSTMVLIRQTVAGVNHLTGLSGTLRPLKLRSPQAVQPEVYPSSTTSTSRSRSASRRRAVWLGVHSPKGMCCAKPDGHSWNQRFGHGAVNGASRQLGRPW